MGTRGRLIYIVELIPIRPLRVFAVEALAKVKDAERLRPYRDLFERLQNGSGRVIAYNAGVIVDKLQAMAAQEEVGGPGTGHEDEDE